MNLPSPVMPAKWPARSPMFETDLGPLDDEKPTVVLPSSLAIARARPSSENSALRSCWLKLNSAVIPSLARTPRK